MLIIIVVAALGRLKADIHPIWPVNSRSSGLRRYRSSAITLPSFGSAPGLTSSSVVAEQRAQGIGDLLAETPLDHRRRCWWSRALDLHSRVVGSSFWLRSRRPTGPQLGDPQTKTAATGSAQHVRRFGIAWSGGLPIDPARYRTYQYPHQRWDTGRACAFMAATSSTARSWGP